MGHVRVNFRKSTSSKYVRSEFLRLYLEIAERHGGYLLLRHPFIALSRIDDCFYALQETGANFYAPKCVYFWYLLGGFRRKLEASTPCIGPVGDASFANATNDIGRPGFPNPVRGDPPSLRDGVWRCYGLHRPSSSKGMSYRWESAFQLLRQSQWPRSSRPSVLGGLFPCVLEY